MVIYKRFKFKALINNNIFQKGIISIVSVIILFVICSICIIPPKYSFVQNDVAPLDIKSPKDFVDDIATNNKINKAIAEVSDQYYKDINVEKDAVVTIKAFLEGAIDIKKLSIPDKDKVIRLKQLADIRITDEDYLATLKLKDEEINFLNIFLSKNISKILSRDIKDGSEEDIKKAQEDLNFYARNSTMTKVIRELTQNIGISLIKPNLFFDKVSTEEIKTQIKKKTEPIIIKKNQNIVLKGEIITSEDLYRMKKAGLIRANGAIDIKTYLGIALIILLAVVVMLLFLTKFKKIIVETNSKLLLIAIIVCLSALLTVGMNELSVYFTPTGFIAIMLTMIFDPVVAFAVSIPSLLFLSCITNFSVEAIVVNLIGVLTGVLFTQKANQRNNVFFSGMFIGIINTIIIFSFGLINSDNIVQNMVNSSYGLASGILSAILAIGILPFFEQFFDIITPIKLMELANPNQTLLKKMLFDAPGTYHHSILVGNLSEAAAFEIGANSLLARVGAYYHDIGKVKRPYFFKENQITNDNPHDKITPKLSTIIITSHVKDGIELANEYKLPLAVKDIIAQHHGTTLVKYFYAIAINEEEEIVEESFRYDGPKPKTKEAAIVMLADSIEAGVRSLSNPSIADFEKMIDKIYKDKLEDKQLEDCDLTLKELNEVKRSFINVLCGIFHSRIEYPEINTEIE